MFLKIIEKEVLGFEPRFTGSEPAVITLIRHLRESLPGFEPGVADSKSAVLNHYTTDSDIYQHVTFVVGELSSEAERRIPDPQVRGSSPLVLIHFYSKCKRWIQDSNLCGRKPT